MEKDPFIGIQYLFTVCFVLFLVLEYVVEILCSKLLELVLPIPSSPQLVLIMFAICNAVGDISV